MNRIKQAIQSAQDFRPIAPDAIMDWPSEACETEERSIWGSGFFHWAGPMKHISPVVQYDEHWADAVPELINKLAALVEYKKK